MAGTIDIEDGKVTIDLGSGAKVSTWRDGGWTILHVQDGGGGVATVSLPALRTLDLAELLRGSGITAAVAPNGTR